MEAYSSSSVQTGEENSEAGAKRRVKWANSASAVMEGKETEQQAQNKRIQQLESELAEQRREVRQLQANLQKCYNNTRSQRQPDVATEWRGQWPNPAAVTFQPAAQYLPPTTHQPAVQPQQSSSMPTSSTPGYRRLSRDTCARCGQKGHWQRSPECPLNAANNVASNTSVTSTVGTASNGNNPTSTTSVAGNVNNGNNPRCGGVSFTHVYSETYIDLVVCDNIKAHALLDTGCDKSLIPRKMVPTATLYPCDTEMYAANGSKIALLGRMHLKFTIQGLPLHADLFVSDDVDEFMLGYIQLVV